MISLSNFLKKAFRSRLIRCVSPPLVGAVLAIFVGFDVYAVSTCMLDNVYVYFNNNRAFYGNILVNGFVHNFTYGPDSIDIIDVVTGGTLASYKSEIDFWQDNKGNIIYDEVTAAAQNFSLNHKIRIALHYNSDISFKFYFGFVSDSPGTANVNGVYMPGDIKVQYIVPGTGSGYIDFNTYYTEDFVVNYNNIFFLGDFVLFSNWSKDYNVKLNYYREVTIDDVVSNGLAINFRLIYIPDSSATSRSYFTYNRVDGDILNQIDNDINNQTAQDKQFHDQDRSDATQAGSDMAALGTQLETVKNKWEILWYPIEFTNLVFSAFQGTSTAAYSSYYGNVTGYTYNNTLGVLEPVISTARAAPRGVSGTNITFPSFTLPVLGVKVWDDYTFDLSTVKDFFPALFDAIYVFISILEVWWFVGFLRDKYEEVFG